MKWLWSVWLLLATLAPARAAPALHVKADAHLESALLEAFRLQFPQLETLTSAAVEGEDRIVEVASDETGVLLTVRRVDGEVLLSRRLAASSAAATTCALIVDRFFTETQWAGTAATADTRPLPPAPTADRGIASRSYLLGLGASLTQGMDRDFASAGPELSLWMRGSRWLLGLRGGIGFLRDRDVIAADPLLGPTRLGKVSSGTGFMNASAGPCLGTRVFGCAAAVVGVVATWARSAGDDLYRRQSVFDIQPVAGLGLGGGIGQLPWDLQLQGEVTGLRRFGASDVAVEGIGSVLQSPSFELGLTLRLVRPLQ